MLTQTLDPKYVLKNRSEAMRYLKLAKRGFQHRASALQKDILDLEDPLRTTTAFIAEVLAQGQGHFDARYVKRDGAGLGYGMEVHHFDLDADLMDALEDRFGEQAVAEGGLWLLGRLQQESSIFISWALGELRFEEGNHRTLLENRILWLNQEREFQAVLSHMDWRHPHCMAYPLTGGQHPLRELPGFGG